MDDHTLSNLEYSLCKWVTERRAVEVLSTAYMCRLWNGDEHRVYNDRLWDSLLQLDGRLYFAFNIWNNVAYWE